MEINAQEGCLHVHLSSGKKKKNEKKNEKKSDDFQELISQELLGPFLSNLMCKVHEGIKYINLVEIGAILFEL